MFQLSGFYYRVREPLSLDYWASVMVRIETGDLGFLLLLGSYQPDNQEPRSLNYRNG